MLYELLMLAGGITVMYFKESRELIIGTVILIFKFLLWINGIVFGDPKSTKGSKPAKPVPPRPRNSGGKVKTSAQTQAPAIPPRRKRSSSKKQQQSGPLTAEQKAKKAEKKRVKRRNAELEMVDCEDAYIKNLQTLLNVYKSPMEKYRKSINLEPRDLQTIFSPMLPAIVTLHTTLLQEFQQKGGRKCGEVLLTKAPYFKMYTQYLNGYDKAMDRIGDLRTKNRKFEKFLAKQRKGDIKERRKWKYMDIASYLIMPVQRIPRYELLLKEIIKNTPEGDAELPSLNKALNMVRDAAQHNNQSMRSYQDVQKIVQIQSMLVGELKEDIIQPHRVLINSIKAEVSMLSPEDAEALHDGKWIGSRRSILKRRYLASTGGRRQDSMGSAVADFQAMMEEKISRMKQLKMVDEECNLIVFNDLLVWVAVREIQHRQGYLELDESVTIENVIVGGSKPDNATTTCVCLIRSDAANLKVTFESAKVLEGFRKSLETALDHQRH
mmetsp:Transcript_24383/g.43259  ORF Transcript_24383/g.43259 Transcript_24383/m.43259 type:complete len:495 (+) Transcript_24383:167-1651(+)